MIVGDYVEDYRKVMVPFQALPDRSATPFTRLPGQKVREFVRHRYPYFEGGPDLYPKKRGHNVELNTTFDQIKPKSMTALVLPGGRRSGIHSPAIRGHRNRSPTFQRE